MDQISGGNNHNNNSLVLSTKKNNSLVLAPTQPFRWTPELHKCFVNAVNQLGGLDRATASKVHKAMCVPGLTRPQVHSHLQKYRTSKKSKPQTSSRNKELSKAGSSSSNYLGVSDYEKLMKGWKRDSPTSSTQPLVTRDLIGNMVESQIDDISPRPSTQPLITRDLISNMVESQTTDDSEDSDEELMYGS